MKLLDSLNALALREKVLVLVAGWVLLLALVGLTWLEPLLADNSAQGRRQQLQQAQLTEQRGALAILEAKLAQDPNQQLRGDIAKLQAQQVAQQQAIYAKTQALVPPQAMASLLEALLKGTGQLKLISLTSLPPEPLQDEANAGLYRHGLELKLQGGYLPLLAFLTQAEQLPWQFYWQGLDFEQTTYPDAEILIHVYTLGTSPHYLGA
ncbi:hypothetical protein [Gallaecimonas xiamenensis]|uniref:Type IV pilus, mannose-sensitive hemagglutinin D (MSHJ) n=1 Tax=Gallaecimonas xiamenensis 3-C-1 TaxID=745411 RepID=K2IXU7_9GAMM|nr:hypothetical protein [Gallaecimonas xiamenensis]EKE67452.1 type IV pilus, mannose-sensitive hemagglutinin D (MSHJ) [Gallaecimonas xiamenensis 3-C-1]